MRSTMLACVSLLAFGISAATSASATTFGYTGNLQYFTAPTTGLYGITAFSIQGGNDGISSGGRC